MGVQHADEPLEAVIDHFTSWLRANGAGSTRTLTARIRAVTACAEAAGVDPRHLTEQHITAWLGRQGLSKNSRHTYFGHLQAWTRFLEETGRAERDVMRRMRRPRAARGKPDPLPEHIIDAALATARGRTLTYLVLGLYAGLRVHEIAKIRGEDVEADVLTVLGKGGQEACIPTHPAVWAEALKYPRYGYWFTSSRPSGHVAGHSISVTLAQLFARLGYSRGHAHQTRHSFGTAALRAAGGNLRVAQELLRHQSPATTAIYTLVDDSERRAAVLQLPWQRPSMPKQSSSAVEVGSVTAA